MRRRRTWKSGQTQLPFYTAGIKDRLVDTETLMPSIRRQQLHFSRVAHIQHLLQIALDMPDLRFLAVLERHSRFVLQQVA